MYNLLSKKYLLFEYVKKTLCFAMACTIGKCACYVK